MLTFILSSGRTGTVFLNNVLNQLPDISAVHERRIRILRIIQNMSLQGFHFPLLNHLLIQSYAKPLSQVKKSECHFEINPTVKGHILELLKTFPNANYIHLVRDPRSLVASGINWVSDKPLNRLFKLYFPFWVDKPYSYTLGNGKQSKNFEIATQNWVTSNNIFLNLKEQTSNYNLVKFEDLVEDPSKVVLSILQFSRYPINQQVEDKIGMAITQASRNESIKVFPSKWAEWDYKYILYLHEKCDLLMQYFGYGNEEQWRKLIQEAKKRNT